MINLPEHPIWSDTKITLIAPEQADAERIAAWWSDREVMQHNVPFAIGPWSTIKSKERLLTRLQDPNEWFWMIFLEEDKVSIGHAGIQILNTSARIGRVSLLIGSKEYRGQGFGKATLKLLLNFGFSELGMNRIELNVMASNNVAIQAYSTIGFHNEGALRSAIFRNNEYIDWIQMSILASEWYQNNER